MQHQLRAATARYAIVAAAILGVGDFVWAQGVTLPSVRVATSSPEVQMLRRVVIAARAMYDSTSSDPDIAGKAVLLNRAVNRLVLAPFTQRQLDKLASASTQDDSMRVLADARAGDEDRAALNRVRVLGAEARRRGQPAIDSVRRPVSEYETGQLLEQLRQQETDAERSALLDTLSRIARAVVIERKVRTRVFFPVRSRDHAIKFWQQPGFSTLNMGSVSGTSDNGAVYTELASPFLHPIRVSVNAVLAVSDDEPSDPPSAAAEPSGEDGDPDVAAVTRFVNGGGLLNVGFALPAARISLPEGALDAMVLVAPRIGGTIPALGASERDTTLVYDAGAELHVKSIDITDGVGLFAQTRFALAGGSGNFGQLLGLSENKAFSYTTFSAGLLLGNRYLITANRTLAGPRSLRSLGWQIGVTAVRKGDR